MSLTLKETKISNDYAPFKEVMCSKCKNYLLCNDTSWPIKCWECGTLMPKLYKYFKTRQVARLMYHMETA